MTAPWSEDQVSALAPDASSLSAARKLAGRWRGTGQLDTALWGLCQGSGSKPYQTIVDLAGPAYKCSCPSRKFPCKHALSLLLTWSGGAVTESTAIADFAAEWINARAARAAEPTATRTTNPATAEQRRVRVTAGLEELDVWLGDQVRTGLAQSDRSFQAFETIAARMVDAQAPGVASALRQLPTAVVTRSDWPDVVLAEYARLHLLIAAHRRLDDLSPELRAGVRTHIGYPIPAETVRAEPAVRDQWQVLGIRTSADERLYTRRTWLYGRQTRRWALLLEHSFGAPNFSAEVPMPGMMADADLHYYPGGAPLRALWGERHGAAEPFTTLPVAEGTIAVALAEHAKALGGDPWLRSRPMLLTGVVPGWTESGWYITESDGTALPVAATEQPWRLLGVSGGHPVTLAADWGIAGLIPISVFTAGEVVDVGGAESAPRQVSNAAAAPVSEDLTSVALLGTARRALDPARLEAPVAAAAARLRTDPALLLLESAALRGAFARGGVSAATATTPEPAEDDARRLLPRAAATRLARMLRDRSAFLPEWFAAATPFDYRAPDALCALLLEQAKAHTELREPLLRLAGARGRWLADQHPEWRDLVRYSDAAPTEQSWQFGQPPERREWLTDLRRRDPDAARTALAASWPKESGPLKAELLAVLAEGISAADEPLLEAALDDRRSDVRRVAAGLLPLLPNSAFAQRMTRRASAWVQVEHLLLHRNLVVRVPESLDDADRRDGITDRTVEFTYRWDGAPDLRAGRLRQLVAATPLAHWESELGAPDKAIQAKISDRFRQPLFDGWVDAALARHDPTWARALFEAGVPTDLAMLRRRELFALLALPDRTRHLLQLDGAWLSELEALLPAVGHPWPETLAQHLILLLFERARAAAKRPESHGSSPSAHRSLLSAAAVHLPVGAARAATLVARRCDDPNWERAFDQLAHDLNHRSMMLEELR
ncbi:SWIM zinc finger family protein [Nocardia sp. NBC_00565]|uniref:SWIM zinc finger family protein n=1 Tax=Nocardia sp. NBC_00565 TaxID=2975993 RepID=UPI002E81ED92|nr:SWIM zinc finger family protein [Nocardia sp. NBC_00565]WUC00608.1 SWIM zinc finger family protein [Nocardia sp. NBC_00565]